MRKPKQWFFTPHGAGVETDAAGLWFKVHEEGEEGVGGRLRFKGSPFLLLTLNMAKPPGDWDLVLGSIRQNGIALGHPLMSSTPEARRRCFTQQCSHLRS